MLFYLFDITGVIVFAISGSLAAGKKRLDIFGALVLALVTALGGGTIRDIILNREPIFWISDLTYIYVVITTTVIVYFVRRYLYKASKVLLYADAFGLAIFSVLGTQIALQQNVPGLVAIIMGMLTGVAGGVIRDLFRDEIPLILHREIYATAALAGAATFVGLVEIISSPFVCLILAAMVTLILRLAAIKWDFSLPLFITKTNR